MDGESDAGSQGNESNIEEENVPAVISDEFFAELTCKTNRAIKSLQADQQIIAAEEFQRVFNVCHSIRKCLIEEQTRVTQMREEIDTLRERVLQGSESIQRNEEIIKTQKTEIGEAWTERDAAQSREKTIQTQMHTMRQKLDGLEKDVKKSQNIGDNEPGMSMTKYKEGMLREQERLNTEIEDLNRKLLIQRQHIEEVERKRTECETKNKELYKILDEASSDAFKEKRLLDQLKISLADVTAERNALSEQIKHYKLQYSTFKTKNIHLNLKIGAAKANLEKMNTQFNLSSLKLNKALSDIESLTAQCDKLQIELNQESTLLKLKEVECNRLLKENGQIFKSRESTQKRLAAVEIERTELTKDVSKLKNAVLTLEKERDVNRKALDKANKMNEEIMRERDISRKDLKKAEDVLDDQRDVIKLQEQHVLSLDNEIKGHLLTIQQQKNLLSNAEKERDRNATSSHTQAGKADATQLELDLKTKQYADLKESYETLQVKLTHLQQRFDALTSERNALQRDLDLTVADREVVREKLRVSVGKREKLNETIIVKDAEVFRAGKQIDKLEKEKSVLKTEIQNITIAIQHTKTELAERTLENTGLYKTLADNETKFVRFNKQLEATQQKRDLIEAQLFKSNDKIEFLKEKQQIIQMALDRGDSQYRNRLDDIALLKIEIGNLRSQKNLLTRGLANTTDMRQEVLQLNRDLTQERVKAKALQEEMMTPMNIHRWRKLTGKDPDKMDLIVKIQTLQKRILCQTASASQKEKHIRQSNMLYESLKENMSKMPGPAIAKRLTNTQRVLTAKTRKLKALSAEANARDLDGKVNEFSLEVMKRELFDNKQILLKEKREKHKLKIELDALKQQMARDTLSTVDSPVPSLSIGYKTAGAGFRIPTVYAYD